MHINSANSKIQKFWFKINDINLEQKPVRCAYICYRTSTKYL